MAIFSQIMTIQAVGLGINSFDWRCSLVTAMTCFADILSMPGKITMTIAATSYAT
jgi:hypothetical protein